MEYPISLEDYKQFINSIAIKQLYRNEFDKVEKYSIHQNYDDYSFFCKNVSLEINTDSQIDNVSEYIRNTLHKTDFYHTLNKSVFLYENDPYEFRLNSLKVVGNATFCCKFDHYDKKIYGTSLLDFNLTGLSRLITIKQSKNLDISIQRILNLSSKTLSYHQIMTEIENVIDIFHFTKMYPDIVNEEEKTKIYLSKRKIQ